MLLDFNTVEIGHKVRTTGYDHDGFVVEKTTMRGRDVVKVRFVDDFENWYPMEWLEAVDDNVVMLRRR